MRRHRFLIAGVLGATLVFSATLHGQQPAAGAQAAPCADPLHTTGPCQVAPGQSASGAGDSARGKAVFEGKGTCQSCHRIAGVGSRIGPDLTNIGSILSPEAIAKALTDPNAALRPMVTSIRAVTKDGRTVVGLRLNEDRYSVQFIDEQEKLRSLDKSELREFAILKTARMPSYRDRLSAQEITDVVSYLRSLK
jgi:putative heme-binding domain-containing protein